MMGFVLLCLCFIAYSLTEAASLGITCAFKLIKTCHASDLG